jgi:hypothetical protein
VSRHRRPSSTPLDELEALLRSLGYGVTSRRDVIRSLAAERLYPDRGGSSKRGRARRVIYRGALRV